MWFKKKIKEIEVNKKEFEEKKKAEMTEEQKRIQEEVDIFVEHVENRIPELAKEGKEVFYMSSVYIEHIKINCSFEDLFKGVAEHFKLKGYKARSWETWVSSELEIKWKNKYV